MRVPAFGLWCCIYSDGREQVRGRGPRPLFSPLEAAAYMLCHNSC